MNLTEVYAELKKANKMVRSAYDHANLDLDAMAKLKKTVEAHDKAFDEFVRLFSDMFEGV
jgi:hypothetical protein